MDFVSIVDDNVFRIVIPYLDITTAVYIIRTEEGVMIFDTAGGDSDINEYVLPVLEDLKIEPESVKYIFISHNHRDHARGLRRLLEVIPNAVVVSRSEALMSDYSDYGFIFPEDGHTLMSVLQVVTIPGHTLDSSAILDTRTKTLITADCLQLVGIFGSGDWACNVNFVKEHFDALDKVGKMDIKKIYTAHDYHPIGYKFTGKYQIKEALNECKKPLLFIAELIKNNPSLDDGEIREAFNNSANIPTVNVNVVKAVRKALAEGMI